MDIGLAFQEASAIETPMLAVFAVAADAVAADTAPSTLLITSHAISSSVESLLASGEFKAGLGEILLLHAPSGLKAERLLIVGVGEHQFTLDSLRKAAGTAVRNAMARTMRSLNIAFPAEINTGLASAATVARAIAEGVILASTNYDTYRSERKENSLGHVTLVVQPDAESGLRNEFQSGFEQGITVATAQNFTRALVNEPGNVLTPTELGRRTKQMCDANGLKCEVFSSEKIQELKMGAFWAVAKGSAQPPALIVITYEPAAAPRADAPVLGLVGKGITFDTGGISIKPADGMEKMKYDMAGAAAMIGAMSVVASLKPNIKVVAVICSAENMPDGAAFRPGDIVTSMSGKTIEIINTDAEGRLVLADGLHYAKTLGCTHLIDAATLTGACKVALGEANFGVFSNDEAAYEQFALALSRSGENGWRLPCTAEYRELMKSRIADIMNTGKNRYGGASSAAAFLREFAGETPWVHLDIAGCAWNEEKKPWLAYGPSGVTVRSIIEWVRGYST